MEVWKDIEGYEYQVSNHGNVKRLSREVNYRHGKRTIKEFPIGFGKDSNGYKISRLYKDGVQKAVKTHRIVAFAFIPNPDNKREVNHKNGIKTDNRVENLEWMTSSENTRHAVASGFHKGVNGEKNHNCKISEGTAFCIKHESNCFTSKELSEIFGISRTQVNDIRAGRRWKHI